MQNWHDKYAVSKSEATTYLSHMAEELYRLTLVTIDNTPGTFEEMNATKPRLRIEVITRSMEQPESGMLGREVVIVVNQRTINCICLGYQPAPYAEEPGIVYIGPYDAQ